MLKGRKTSTLALLLALVLAYASACPPDSCSCFYSYSAFTSLLIFFYLHTLRTLIHLFISSFHSSPSPTLPSPWSSLRGQSDHPSTSLSLLSFLPLSFFLYSPNYSFFFFNDNYDDRQCNKTTRPHTGQRQRVPPASPTHLAHGTEPTRSQEDLQIGETASGRGCWEQGPHGVL